MQVPGVSDMVSMVRLLAAVLLLAAPLISSSAPEVPVDTTIAHISSAGLPGTPGDVFRIRSVVQEVKLSFTVVDSSGRPKLDVKPEDLQIVDEERPAERIRSFTMERELPLRVVFLVDGSASLSKWFRVQNEGVAGFMRRMRPGTDAAAAVVFADAHQFDNRLAGSGPDLIKNIDIRSSENLTALYDVLHRACSALGRIRETGMVRRSLVVISDGEDNASMYGLDQVIVQAQRHEIAVYAIGMGGRNSFGAQVMKRLSRDTGAQSYFPRTTAELQDAFTAIEAELRTQYSVTYSPPGPLLPGSFRSVKINIPGREQFSIKVRAGYFVPREP
jgi:Ca-activated chloride channel family protein